MPKQSQRADVNNFIAGLVTEASPLNFPANASADEQNFELNRDGSRQRRLGMDFESGAGFEVIAASPSVLTGKGFNSFTWNSVNGDPQVSLLVIQYGLSIKIYDLNQDSISTNGPLQTFSLPFDDSKKFSFASVEGFLIVAGGGETFAVVSCDTTVSPFVFALTTDRIKVRDLWGVYNQDNAGMETNLVYHPPILSNYHNYNLRNQSWGIPRKDKTGTQGDPILIYKNALGYYPNSVEQVWIGLQEQPVAVGQDPFERMFPNLYQELDGSSTKISRGYFVIDLLRRGTSRVDAFNAMVSQYSTTIGGSVVLPPDYTTGGTSCITDFAGRIFYSGFQGQVYQGDGRSPNLDNYVCFSKLIKNRADFGLCYQEGDPTSRDSNDVVDTDGGYVRVSGAKNIQCLVNLQTHLIVIAENGVWTITGGTTDSGFTATNYKVGKISTYGGISGASVVLTGESCYYWSADGIYAVSKNQYGDMEVQSLTLKTVQSLYEDIPAASKTTVVGEYDPFAKKVRWVYKTGTQFTNTSETFELVFDLATTAFSQNRIYSTNAFDTEVVGIFKTNAIRSTLNNEEVFAGVDQVFVGSDDVLVASSGIADTINALKYMTLRLISGQVYVSFSFYRDPAFVDWATTDGTGVDAFAFCLTGAITAGDSAINKQTPYLVMHFLRTEEGVDNLFQPLNQSSCMFQGRWGFSDGIQSNKWSPLRQAYRYVKPRLVTGPTDDYDTGFQLITTKNMLKGIGRGFQLYFETEPKKDCRIIGWNITLQGNQFT